MLDFGAKLLPEAQAPNGGTVVSHTVQYKRGAAQQAVIIAEQNGARFVATSQDAGVIEQCLSTDPIGRAIAVTNNDSANTFCFKD